MENEIQSKYRTLVWEDESDKKDMLECRRIAVQKTKCRNGEAIEIIICGAEYLKNGSKVGMTQRYTN